LASSRSFFSSIASESFRRRLRYLPNITAVRRQLRAENMALFLLFQENTFSCVGTETSGR
jgi:hypothetical protein